MILYNAIRIHRNVEGKNFTSTIDNLDATELANKIAESLPSFRHKRLKELTTYELLKLKEEFTTSPNLLNHGEFSSYLEDEDIKIFLMGEDHMVITTMGKENLLEGYRKLSRLDDEISSKINYAFDKDFGYLTTDPSIVGTGLQAFVVISLPATKYFGIKNISKSINRMGYRLEPFKVNNSSLNNIFVLKNMVTIGESELTIINKITSISKEIERIELDNRKKLYLDDIAVLEDMVNRSYGILRNARILKLDEMIDNLTILDLGVSLSIIKKNGNRNLIKSIDSLTNGAIQHDRKQILDGKSLDIVRANLVRKMMKEEF
ncbi:ATP:guanido phosphotransferase, C-terminal catalytic domain protein [Peptoniphilus duerdenii ATCC BAA-1640]|uniref:ATP:guanido phosphotransferase, C-terminal catalytic domain protein n=1 Tax=Peptoniphilus duerdenii ATCC BAA-1640 TaxID=862517 RepID=E0NLN9_9FIRM|nr:arginine kinase [Peptoniphilus duerdenii]EFM25230.1 ATP:guanido phosphotransferase, C-terminal catalytic domain protein [Peptoniphilus duerdenii ATCC BAA-1640]